MTDLPILDCRSEEGITVGLIDALISIGRILSKRDLNSSQHVKEALKDFVVDTDMCLILSIAECAYDISPISICPNCGDNRTGKGSLVFGDNHQQFCNDDCFEEWHTAKMEKYND